jgi:hypothetical protein
MSEDTNMSEVANPPVTIGKIVKELSPGQLWSVLVALAAIVGSAFTAGQQLGTVAKRSEANAVPCSQARDWPQGSWLVWGHLENDWRPSPEKPDEKFPQLAQRVLFDSNVSFQTQSDHLVKSPTKNEFRGKFKAPLQAGAPVVIDGEDPSGYKAQVIGKVTADGCMIHGTFNDSEGNLGSVHYFFERDRYYVTR